MRSWPYYDASHDPDDIHVPWWNRRLSPRSIAILVLIGMILAMWAAAAIGFWLTGSPE